MHPETAENTTFNLRNSLTPSTFEAKTTQGIGEETNKVSRVTGTNQNTSNSTLQNRAMTREPLIAKTMPTNLLLKTN